MTRFRTASRRSRQFVKGKEDVVRSRNENGTLEDTESEMRPWNLSLNFHVTFVRGTRARRLGGGSRDGGVLISRYSPAGAPEVKETRKRY